MSQREIAEVQRCSLRIVSQTIKATKERGIGYEQLAEMDDETIRQLLFNPQTRECEYYLPDWEKADEKLKGRGVSLSLAWDECIRECVGGNLKGYQCSQFRKLYSEWRLKRKRLTGFSWRIKHNAARILEVDWAGDKSSYVCFTSGQSLIDALPKHLGVNVGNK